MKSWGIDLSTDPRSIGIASLDWVRGLPAEADWHRVTDRGFLADFIRDILDDPAAVVAVDVPFGWPVTFSAFLASHSAGPTSASADPGVSERAWELLEKRVTDRWVRDELGIGGFNVSFDKLGATAAYWAQIEHELCDQGIKIDRTGREGRIIETWPRAAWLQLELQGNPATFAAESFAATLKDAVSFNNETWASLGKGRRPHVQDAIVCALVARARFLDQTVGPPPESVEIAKREGHEAAALLGHDVQTYRRFYLVADDAGAASAAGVAGQVFAV